MDYPKRREKNPFNTNTQTVKDKFAVGASQIHFKGTVQLKTVL